MRDVPVTVGGVSCPERPRRLPAVVVLPVVFALLAGVACTRPGTQQHTGTQQRKTTTEDEWSTVRKRAEQGDAVAQQSLGYSYSVGEGVPLDYAEAAKWLRKAAEQGDPAGQYNLASLYADGRGVPLDLAEASRWLRKAAEQGYVLAQGDLGAMYVAGQGVPQDFAEGVKWLRLAAEQGLPSAQGALGEAYSHGAGVSQDLVEACKWYILASSQAAGEEQQRFAATREELIAKMAPAQVTEAQKRSAAWVAAYEKRKKP
jgi:hypothetical protein